MRMRYLIFIYVCIFFIGIFDISWWALIPLITAIILFINSKEMITFFTDSEIEEDEIPCSIRKKWVKIKGVILTVSVWLYVDLIVANQLKDTKVYYVVLSINPLLEGKGIALSEKDLIKKGVTLDNFFL